MIRVEQDMLVLDSTISKKDVQAINEFLEITKRQERERIIKLLDKDYWHSQLFNFAEVICLADCEMCKTIALIKGEK